MSGLEPRSLDLDAQPDSFQSCTGMSCLSLEVWSEAVLSEVICSVAAHLERFGLNLDVQYELGCPCWNGPI